MARLQKKWWESIGIPAENCRVVLITPSLAEEWLRRNNRNRPVSQFNTTSIAKKIADGEWVLNGETIVFASNGDLLNGQHRLTAIAVTGISVKSYVIFDVSEQSFATFDEHKKRNGADVLSIAGKENCFLLQAMARLVVMWTEGRNPSRQGRNTISNTKILETVNRFPELAEAARVCHAFNKWGTPSLFGFVYFLASRTEKEKVVRFMDQVATGAGLQKHDPAHTLRERLSDNRGKRAGLHPDEILVFIMKSWNAYYDGHKLKILRWAKGEAWPILKGDNLFGIDAIEPEEAGTILYG